MNSIELTPTPAPRPFMGVPSFFRALCRDAAQRKHTYRDVGRNFAGHIPRLESDAYADSASFEARLVALGALLRADDREGVLGWLCAEYPRCMKVVPRRRQSSFVDGVLDAYEHGKLDDLPSASRG